MDYLVVIMCSQLKSLLVILIAISLSVAQNTTLEREKRVVLQFPINSATGILCALSVPLDLDSRNIFVSYNFEANYGMPIEPTDVFPGPLTRLEDVPNEADGGGENAEGGRSGKDNVEIVPNGTVDRIKKTEVNFPTTSKPEGLLSRSNVYKMLIKKMTSEGHMNGKPCLLRAICDAASNPIHEHNGVLGDLIHIILTPSTSQKEEKLHPQFYTAELDGKNNNCTLYDKKCPENVLDYFSDFI